MDTKMRDRFQQRLSPQLFSSDEGPETGDESDEDIIRNYLPGDNHDIIRNYEPHHNIPAINITLHSANTNHVLEAEICQLADIQDSIQRMREGEVCQSQAEKQSVEARLSSSCPSLVVDSGEEAGGAGGGVDTPEGGRRPRARAQTQHFKDQRDYRKRAGRQRSPSVSTGDSEEEGGEAVRGAGGAGSHAGLEAGGGLGGLQALHKSISTPSMVDNDNAGATNGNHQGKTSSDESLNARWSNQRSGTDSETECEDVRGVIREETVVPPVVRPAQNNQGYVASPQLTLAEFLQKDLFSPTLTEEDRRKQRRNKKERGGSLFSLRKKKDKKEGSKGLSKAGSAVSLQSRHVTAPRVPQHSYSMSSLKRNNPPQTSQFYLARSESSSPQGLGWFNPGWTSPSHWTSDGSSSQRGKDRTSPGPSPKLNGRTPSPRMWAHRTNRWRRVGKKLGVIKSTEEREEVENDRENLLDSELLPAEEFPDSFPISLRHLDTDPFLRIQREEPETWAGSVPEGVVAALKSHEAKRQEHIYEFIITEKHHCQLLKVIQKVFCEGMVTYLDMKPELLDRLFPQLDTLISLHFEFLRQLRERQDSTTVISTIADILMTQFGQEENVTKWKAAYGAFCSQHSDAVSIYKDVLKSDRRFQEFVQQCSNNPLLRKMGIPECILTVTTRITKYPLLIEPLIKTAKERPEEQQKLRNCLHLVKSILVDVNGQVAEKERGQRLLEIYNRMDARSHVSHEGKKFKKSDILSENRKLLFEGVGHLLSPALLPNNTGGKGNRSPAPSLLINILVLSDVVIFLQESNQKYNFVTPEGKSGVVAVHSLIAREKPGQDNKALYLISTSDREPEMYELQVVQPRDRQDWINGVRRAVDLSTGGPGEEEQFETEAEQARKQLEAKYMKMRQLTSELRGKDMELARLLEDKMRILAEMLDELGVEQPFDSTVCRYLQLVQDKEGGSVTKEQLLQEVQEAAKLASSLYSSGGALGRSVSSVGELQSQGYQTPELPRRAETFAGFDNTASGPAGTANTVNNNLPPSTTSTTNPSGEVKAPSRELELSLPPASVSALSPLLGLDRSEQGVAVAMTHYLNNIMCMVSEHFTSLESIKVELAECKERAALGWGRYKHNQQLEELRNLQEQLSQERRHWQSYRDEQDREITEAQDQMGRMQAALEQERKDVEEQRNKLYRKLEALQAQGFEIGPNMAVIGPHMQQPNSEPTFVMEVRKTVSPQGENRKVTSAQSPPATVASVTERKPSQLQPQTSNSALKKLSDNKNHHLLSATNESKGEKGEVKQQIPYTLAKLSLAGSKSREKKSCSKLVERPSISAPIITSAHPQPGGPQQMLPFKLSETDRDRKNSSPKTGYQKLSSSSFAEDRVGRPQQREAQLSHVRTGSSPASMIGRSISNTLPKHSVRTNSPENKALKEIQKVNYAESGEEVFFF